MKSAEAIVALIELARGERRYSLEGSRDRRSAEHRARDYSSELAVAFDRIDRLERVLAERTGWPWRNCARSITGGQAAEERQEATEALFARVLRIRLDPRADAAKD